MRRSSFVVWALAGFVCGGTGWAFGSLLGSFLPQTVIGASAVGVALGILTRQVRIAVLSGAAAGLTAAVAFLIGGRIATAFAAWPCAALVIGIFAAILLSRRGARIATLVAAPFLGTAGFIVGGAGLFLVGLALNESRIVAEFMGGGSAGFGLFTLGGIRIMGGWLDRMPGTAQ